MKPLFALKHLPYLLPLPYHLHARLSPVGSRDLGLGLQTFYRKISHMLFSCVAPAWCCEPLVRSKNILCVHFDDLFV